LSSKLKLFSFTGGIHPPHNKHLTEDKKIEICKVPEIVAIPLQQHTGAPCEALVKIGDEVKLGQKIGQSRGFVSAPVHSSVSGIVKSIETVNLPNGGKSKAIIIANDGKDTLDGSLNTEKKLEDLSRNELLNIITEAGIVGLGGACFPTHVKLSPPDDKKIELVILNGSECEPYLTSDYRLMIEYPEEIIYGMKVIMKILGVSQGYIAIEDNKPEAIESMKDAAQYHDGIQVLSLPTRYPQGAEKQLIYSITGCQVPSGGLPTDIGIEVNNVCTAAAISRAVRIGQPLYQRIVTVSGGAVREPKNLLVRIGTSFREVIDYCGGWTEEPEKIISGGPMMGTAQHTLDVPVTKETSGILLFTKKEAAKAEPSNCIRCARCLHVCPIGLLPMNISSQSLMGNYEEAEKLHALDCIECGCCSYICPASRPLLHSIRVAKREILAANKQNTQTKQEVESNEQKNK